MPYPCSRTGMSVGVALPAFLFEKGRAAPLVLALIVGAQVPLWLPFFRHVTARSAVVGILAPLAGVVHYILQQSKYTGNILQKTVAAFHFFTEQKNSLISRFVAARVGAPAPAALSAAAHAQQSAGDLDLRRRVHAHASSPYGRVAAAAARRGLTPRG